MRPLEPQLLCAMKHLAVDTDLGKQDVQARHRIRENGCPPITDPHHQRRFVVVHRDDRVCGEDQLGPRPRKANEGQAGQNCREGEPADDLGRRNQVAVQCCRIHLAIADGCNRLYAEEKDVHEATRSSMPHRSGNQPEKNGKSDIHEKIKYE